ncbi:MAG: hypothetical protein ACYC1D_01170 [Acidimicrobiales bacterium]
MDDRMGKILGMPKVDPDSGEMMSDDPEQAPVDAQGGKHEEDLPNETNPTGSDALTQQGRTAPPKDDSSTKKDSAFSPQ